MNSLLRFVDLGPYEPIHESSVFASGKVAPIGSTPVRPEAGQLVYQDLESQLTHFDPRSNLASVLFNLRAPADDETLAAAEAALIRMRAHEGEDINEWASVLANDLASLRD
jgi:hypothetical protein